MKNDEMITFVSVWGKDLHSAWSGTPEGLYSALKKFATIRLLYKPHKEQTKGRKVFSLIQELIIPNRRIVQIINNDNEIDTKNPYFVFGEYNSRVVNNTYCYQDLSADFCVRYSDTLYQNPKMRIICKRNRRRAKKFYANCAGIFTMSDWLRKDLIENTGVPECKVHHVGGGCSLDVSLIDTTEKKGNKFIFVGKDWERKNGDLVVSAFKKLYTLHSDKHLELYIAGPDVIPDSCRNVQGIFYLGRLSYSELAQYYNMCDFFVMPSKFEAYGLVFAEALIFGLPCIGMNRFAMPEFIQNGKNGYLIDNNDDDELRLAMEKLLVSGKVIAKNVQDNQAYYINKYSWDTVAQRILAVIKKDRTKYN